jgi:hypothetical protein
MFFDFNTFTRLFFYLFLCYHYFNFNNPEKTQQFVVFLGYSSVYLYSKLQILFYQNCKLIHNCLVKYEKYQQILLFLEKIQEQSNGESNTVLTQEVTMDFILNNEIDFSFEKNEFINDYLNDFFPDEQIEQEVKKEPQESQPDEPLEIEEKEEKDDIIDYDFIIINGVNNLKKIIKHVDLIKNDIISEKSTILTLKPFEYKPFLCEFLNGDGSVIKIDFCDNDKSYNFFVVDNCFDKTFLIYFMKKYYDVEVKEKYILKILDNDVNTTLFDSSEIVKLDENFICKINK